RVLIAGGFRKGEEGRGQVFLNSAEMYDPTAKKFSTTADMTFNRAGHTATLLTNGLVLVAGGFGAMGVLSSAELFNPADGSFTPIGNMNARRGGCTATLLLDGRVLFCGGGDREATASAELFDPARKSFVMTGAMTTPRMAHTATRLPGGMVLVIGGGSRRNSVLGSAEIYNPATGRFTSTSSMAGPRYKHAAIDMNDGSVLVFGGCDERDWEGKLATIERYMLASGRFLRVADLRYARFKLPDAVVGFADGTFLIAGGDRAVERFSSVSDESSVVGMLDKSYYYATATALTDGTVLIAGGYDDTLQATNKAWLWRP
ncbi:MAG: kelch repeat-containing protein, partial [Bacteroidota bacterium]